MKRGWDRQRLGDVLKVQNGYAFDSKRFNPTNGLPLIRIRSLKPGVETETRYDGEYDEKYVVRAGDLLIGMDGEFGCYKWKGEPSLLNQRVCRLQGFSSELLPRFLFYGVNDYLKAIEDVTGYATVKHLSSKQILSIQFPVPPLTEQQRIVGILDEAFEAIATAKANAEKNLQNARALFESHLNAVFTQRGEGWVEKPLKGFVDDISTGPFGSLLHKSDYEVGGVPLVNPINIVDSRIVPDERKAVGKATAERLSRYALRENDIVIARRGEIGRCAVISADQAGWLCGTGSFFIRPSYQTDSYFLAHLLRSQHYRKQLEQLSERATMPSISNSDLANLVIAVPAVIRQKRIVSLLDNLVEETQNLESIYQRKLAALDELKRALLHQAFSGEL